MKCRLISSIAIFMMTLAAMADDVPGITIEYIDNSTATYVQAISAIGKIKFEGKNGVMHAIIEFNDTKLEDEDLGAVNKIDRISFGNIDKENTATDIKDVIINKHKGISIIAYPNPTYDHVHVDGLYDGQTIHIFSVDGRVVYAGKESDINLGDKANGIYILQAGNEVVKIIKK